VSAVYWEWGQLSITRLRRQTSILLPLSEWLCSVVEVQGSEWSFNSAAAGFFGVCMGMVKVCSEVFCS